MKRSFLIIIICVISVLSHAQSCDKGCCKLTKTQPDGTLPKGKAKLVLKFFGADGKQVRSNVQWLLGRDTLLAKINSKGVYQIYVRPDKYKMKFKMPFWYVVKGEQTFKASNTYFLNVKFEAKEMVSGKNYKDSWE